MNHLTTEYHGVTPTTIPDGPEPVPQSNYPEAVYPPPANEKWSSPSPVAPHNLPPACGPSVPEKRICGLRRTTFILLVLLAIAIVAAAVGGGVGGSRAVDGAYDRGFADGLTEADSDPGAGGRIKTPPTSGQVELDCPNLTGTTHEVQVGSSKVEFVARCGINHPSGDLARLPAYSFRDCLIACATYNDYNVTARNCVATQFYSRLRTENGGNCWLKYEIGESQENENEKTKNDNVAAELLS